MDATSQNDARLSKSIFLCPSCAIPKALGGYGWNDRNLGVGASSSTYSQYVRMTEVSMPSQTFMAGDGADIEPSGTGDWFYQKFMPPSAYGLPGIGTRHMNGIDCVHVDSHVGWMSKKAIYSGQNGNWNWYYLRTK